MPRHIKYSDTVRQLATRAREIAMDRDVLYHGTRYTRSILKTGVLFRSLSGGDPKVCFTRSAEVAAYWSLIDRDDDEGCGSVLIFDRRSLECRYKIKANPEVYWHSKITFHDEAEEEIWDNVVDVRNHLIGVVSGPERLDSRPLTPKLRRALKRRHKTAIEARVIKLPISRNATKLTKISRPNLDVQ